VVNGGAHTQRQHVVKLVAKGGLESNHGYFGFTALVAASKGVFKLALATHGGVNAHTKMPGIINRGYKITKGDSAKRHHIALVGAALICTCEPGCTKGSVCIHAHIGGCAIFNVGMRINKR